MPGGASPMSTSRIIELTMMLFETSVLPVSFELLLALVIELQRASSRAALKGKGVEREIVVDHIMMNWK